MINFSSETGVVFLMGTGKNECQKVLIFFGFTFYIYIKQQFKTNKKEIQVFTQYGRSPQLLEMCFFSLPSMESRSPGPYSAIAFGMLGSV